MVRKYLRFDPSQPFISIAAILAFLGVAVGVMVLIVAMSIMNGFDKEFREKLFVMNYPITVMPRFSETMSAEVYEKLRAEFGEFDLSPFVRAQAISRKGSIMEGNIVFGVDFALESKVNKVVKNAITHSDYKPFSVIVGKSLARSLDLKDYEKLLLVFTTLEPAGFSLAPVMKRFEVTDFFESGLIAYDKAYLYVNIDDLRKVMKIGDDRIHGVHIVSPDPMRDIAKIKSVLGVEAYAVGWWEQNSNFFSALELEKRALFLVLMLIILVASLNIVSSLLMTVLNRRKEIALLLSLGASKKSVKRIFFLIGTIVGISGIVVGVLLGGVVLWALDTFDLVTIAADVYGTSKLPLDLPFVDFLSIVFGAFLIVIFSSWYPAKKASEVDVLGTLRHE